MIEMKNDRSKKYKFYAKERYNVKTAGVIVWFLESSQDLIFGSWNKSAIQLLFEHLKPSQSEYVLFSFSYCLVQ